MFDITKVTKNVQSVKSRHQYYRFFLKKVVNIAILELGLVPNESPGKSTLHSIGVFSNFQILKNDGFLKFYAVISISQKIL